MEEIKRFVPHVQFDNTGSIFELETLARRHRILAGSRYDTKKLKRWIKLLDEKPDPIYQRLSKKYGVQVAIRA